MHVNFTLETTSVVNNTNKLKKISKQKRIPERSGDAELGINTSTTRDEGNDEGTLKTTNSSIVTTNNFKKNINKDDDQNFKALHQHPTKDGNRISEKYAVSALKKKEPPSFGRKKVFKTASDLLRMNIRHKQLKNRKEVDEEIARNATNITNKKANNVENKSVRNWKEFEFFNKAATFEDILRSRSGDKVAKEGKYGASAI
uniref:RRP15-like protein n=1 Tax=Angiostrongylus cantonensis TaxID=6313 RepID=A0A0K0D5A1_ANGCA